MKKRRPKVADPFLNPCSACGAKVNEPCDTSRSNPLPLVPRATRLVHADRIGER